jgi:hypothetical protein
MGRKWPALAVVVVALWATGSASASPRVQYGIKDDAWLAFGPGTLEQRVRKLDQLGVKIVRYTLRWDEIATRRPRYPRWSGAPAYSWGSADRVLKALHRHHIPAVLGINGAPLWANGGRDPNFAPTSAMFMSDFARAAAQRYPWVRRWLIWNEPNQARFLRPTTPEVYVQRLLNPAYTALHARNARNRVGGGLTAPRGKLSPVTWIRRMAAAGAKLDAYAHHPYPEDPHVESPISGGCGHCRSITMATLGRLERATLAAWGPIPLWLTEYGYQTNPPDRADGVSFVKQARYEEDAALRAYQSARVEMLIHFMFRDDPNPAGWQSGFFTANGLAKPAVQAFPLPLAQVSRTGTSTVIWGQVRPHHGTRPFRLQRLVSGRWAWITGTLQTNERGFLRRAVRAGPGAKFRLWSALDGRFGFVLVVH